MNVLVRSIQHLYLASLAIEEYHKSPDGNNVYGSLPLLYSLEAQEYFHMQKGREFALLDLVMYMIGNA